MLETIEIETSLPAKASIIWLHGLGASGDDFARIVPVLNLPDALGLRFIFPHAPVQPVTLNGGLEMRSWFDIFALEEGAPQDEAGIRRGEAQIVELIEQEHARGIPYDKIILAGFSQGGALAIHTALRFPKQLAGLMGLSTLVVLGDKILNESTPANQQLPILMAHGTEDLVLPYAFGEQSATLLTSLGFPVEWKAYPILLPNYVITKAIAPYLQTTST